MNEQLLKDFIATAEKYNNNWNVVFSKFPELQGYDQQLLKDYVATAQKYNYDYATVNPKFPEFGFQGSGEVKKKEPTQASSGNGSNQTQQSSGSQPSQSKDFWEQANELVVGPKKTTLSQVEEVEAGTAAPAEFGLEGIRKVKGPSIEAVSESTAPKMPGYINIAQQEAEKTQKPKDNIFEYKATPQEQAQIKTDKANRVAFAEEQRKAADYNYNNLNKELYDIYEGNDITGIESQLNKIETDYKNGAFAGKEDEYQALKTDLFNRRANSYSQLESKYLDILREDEPSKYKEYVERRAGILKDLNEAGYASWDDYQLKRDLNDQKTGAKRDLYSNIDDSFDVVDKADQNFLRTLRMEAINQVSAPNVNGEGNYIPGLGTGFKSAGTIEKFHKDTQPIMSDYEALMNENAAFERDYQAGKYTPEDANAKYQELKLKEQQLSTRLNQAKKESGVTDYDLQRYDLSMRKQGALGSTYETGFKDLKATEDAIRTEQENRQRWVAENPVLGTLTYFAPTVWKEFSNMAVLEAGKALKPLGETVGLGDGYGWTDAMYYGIKDVQENREALYGYGGQDINGDGVPDDLPGFAKYGQVLAQGLGSVGAFMIPGTYANNLFKGSSLGMRSARFATNWAGGFLMMEGPAYDEALRAGLSNEDAARSATLIATLQSAAEQLVPDIKYLEAPVTRAGILSMVKAGVPYDKIMSNGMKYLQDLSTATGKSSLKEAGEEVVGQFATDVGQTISNDAFVRTTHFNMNDPMHPEYSTKPYDNTWELKNYTDAAIGGALTGGFMTGIKGATRTYTKNEMEALSYMGKNWKDILANIEKTESNGVNRGDERFKEIEKDLKGVSTLYQSLQSMPGFKEMTKANQDVVLALAFQKKNIQENVRNLGVELPSVKEALAGIDERINAYMTGQLDYGADKPVSYIDDNLAAMGVALVSVNPDGTYNISPKNIEGVDPDSIVKKAEEYIQKNIKDESFADSFLHPKTDKNAIQKSIAEGVFPRQQGETTEAGGQRQGMGPGVQGQKTTQEKEVEAKAADIVAQLNVPNQLASTVYPIIGEVETQMNNNETINEGKLNEAQDKLYEFLGDIDAREDLTPEQKKNMSEVIENRILNLQNYDNRSRTETSTSTQTVATGVSPKAQKQNERAKTPIRTIAEEGVDITYDGRQGKVELRDGNYFFIPNKLGAVQARPILIGEAAQVNGNSRFAGIENPTKGKNNSVANITLPNGVNLAILNDDLSIDVGLEIAKQEIGIAPQALFDAVFDEIVSEQKKEVPVVKEEVKKEEPVAEEPVAEEPATEKPVAEEKKPVLETKGNKPNLFNSERKNALLAKFRNDSGKRALVSSIDRAVSAIRQAYGNVPVYVHETTAEMQAATALTGGATMARTGAGSFQYDADGNVIAVHINLAKAGTDTAPHEFTHLILMDAFGDNPKLFKEFKNRIVKALSASRVAELEAFANQYTDENVKPEEFIAQLAGVMTANREKLTPTMAQKIMNLINEFISRLTKGKLIPFKANAQTKDLMDFFNTVSSAMATGQGGENIIAAAEKAGSKFKNAQKETGEAGARDRSREQNKNDRVRDANSYKKYYIPNEMGGVSELTPQNYLAALKELLSTGSIENLNKYNPKDLTEKQFPLNETNAQNPTFIKTNYDGWEKTVQFEIDGVEDRIAKSKEQNKETGSNTDSFFNAADEAFPNDHILGGYAVTDSNNKLIGRVVLSYVDDNTVKVDEVVSEQRGQRTGNGSAIMNKVIDLADKNNVTLTLTPNLILSLKAKGFETPAKLQAFYEKFGFVKDSKKATMTRVPNPTAKSKEAIVGEYGTAEDEIAINDLEIAKDMQAENRAAQDIKSATGWEVGADGKWRYEYPDVELIEGIESDFDILYYLQENAKKEGVRVRPNENYPPAPITDILDLGKLEEAYPYLADVTFSINPDLGNAAAVFRTSRNLIEFGPEAIENEGVEGFRRTLIHEIQHYIQDTEGFEYGGNVDDKADEFAKSKDVYKIPGFSLGGSKTVGAAVTKAVNEILEMMTYGASLEDISNSKYDKELYSNNPAAILKYIGNDNDMLESIDDLAKDDLERAKRFVESVIAQNVVRQVAYDEYRRMAGEVEARNAEDRSRIPYAERLYGKTLESTEQVARRDQILESAKKAVSAMDVIAKKRGVSKAAEIKAQREILGENYDKAKQISDNFEDIAEKLGITKICGL